LSRFNLTVAGADVAVPNIVTLSSDPPLPTVLYFLYRNSGGMQLAVWATYVSCDTEPMEVNVALVGREFGLNTILQKWFSDSQL
jgi:hypothetical protein